MDQVLITGGAGFIGVNLVKFLVARGRQVRVLDNLTTGQVSDLQGLPAEVLIGDIREADVVERGLAGVKDVIHLAANTGVVQSMADPQTDMEINVLGTLRLLQGAVRQRVERFVFGSTGGAILGQVTPPVNEEMVPRPISPYGASKLAGEGYCSAFWGSYGIKTISLRFTNVYGPYSYHKGSVIARFFRQIQEGQKLVIYGDGEQTRDFLYVADLCLAVAATLEADLPWGQAIQLGTGLESSINSLVKVMRRVVGEERFPGVSYVPRRPGEVERSFVSIDKARRFLNFNPQIHLEIGLEKTWKWFGSGKRSQV
jgi:UDP-glucose 4-epimerase